MDRKECDLGPEVFVMRFWREGSTGDGRVRGQIEHVASGQRRPLTDLDQIKAFVDRRLRGEMGEADPSR